MVGVVGVTLIGIAGNHGPDELVVLYCKLYDNIGAPPVLTGGAHVTKDRWLSHDTEDVKTGAIGIVEGVISIILDCEPTPTPLTAET